MAEGKFNWPEAPVMIPKQKWIRDHGAYSQHRIWHTEDFRLICRQDYNSAADHARITHVAEAFGGLEQMTEFKAHVKDPSAVETFYGNDADAPMMLRVFLCTASDTLIIELECMAEWDDEAQSMFDAYVEACRIELSLRR
jgi:hypothetical protein